MIYEDYERLISNNENYNLLISMNKIMTQAYRTKNFQETINYLMESEILHLTKLLSSYFLERKVLDTYYRSFARNIRGLLINKSQISNNSIIKYNKTLISYMNLEMITLEHEKIENFLNESILDSHQKIILAIGTVELEDKIRVNEEIKNIFDLSRCQEKYLVIPSIGCTINVFKNLIHKYPISILHIAGHGSLDRLQFVGSNLTPNKFGESLANAKITQLDWICLNCCDSNGFINLLSNNPYWFNDISYIGALKSSLAYDFSNGLYYNFFYNEIGDVYQSFLIAPRDVNYIFR